MVDSDLGREDLLLQEVEQTVEKLVLLDLLRERGQGAAVPRRGAAGRIPDALRDAVQLLRHLRGLLGQVQRVAEEGAEVAGGGGLLVRRLRHVDCGAGCGQEQLAQILHVTVDTRAFKILNRPVYTVAHFLTF